MIYARLRWADRKGFDLALIKNDNFLNWVNLRAYLPNAAKRILDTIGLYGIYIMQDAVYANPRCQPAGSKGYTTARKRCRRICQDYLQSFRPAFRALIKIEGISQHIRGAIRQVRGRISNPAHTALLAQIGAASCRHFRRFAQEHREYELLNAIYNNEIELDPADAEECCTIFGEHGTSAPQLVECPTAPLPTSCFCPCTSNVKTVGELPQPASPTPTNATG